MRRRALLAAPLAMPAMLAACEREAAATSLEAPTAAGLGRPGEPPPALRELAPFSIGTEVLTTDLDEPALAGLAARQFSQITAGFEMKMEVVLRPDGSRNWAPGDRIAAWAAANRQRLHGHCLVWYSQDAPAFRALRGDPRAFTAAYDRYIVDVVRRWPAAGWDVVNEPLEDSGELRPSLWAQVLGAEGYMVRAFQRARAADPRAVLILNEYGLESRPDKRRAFLKLVDRLQKLGAPITGLGTQCHIDVDLPAGTGAAMIADLARTGLPIHVSELDCSLKPGAGGGRPSGRALEIQAARFAELLDAFAALPGRQRHAFTVWGLRDDGSWLNSASEYAGRDAPLLFDRAGAPKPAFLTLARRLRAQA